MKYYAVRFNDYDVYLVEVADDNQNYINDIEIDKKTYEEMLEANQKHGHMIRIREKDGFIELVVCTEQRPSQYHEWSVEHGKWVVDEDLKRKQQREEIEQRIQFLRNEIIYLTALDEDASEEIAESKKLRAQLYD